MAFLSGPRQVGKTTLAESVLPKATRFNYDKASDARIIASGADKVAAAADLFNPAKSRNGIVFDELQKFMGWKRFLKGFFDVYADNEKPDIPNHSLEVASGSIIDGSVHDWTRCSRRTCETLAACRIFADNVRLRICWQQESAAG